MRTNPRSSVSEALRPKPSPASTRVAERVVRPPTERPTTALPFLASMSCVSAAATTPAREVCFATRTVSPAYATVRAVVAASSPSPKVIAKSRASGTHRQRTGKGPSIRSNVSSPSFANAKDFSPPPLRVRP